LNGAQITSNSWGLFGVSSAPETARNGPGQRRDGKGTLNFFAAGNGGGVLYPASLSLSIKGVAAVGCE
jgi:hypothetical protein